MARRLKIQNHLHRTLSNVSKFKTISEEEQSPCNSPKLKQWNGKRNNNATSKII